MQCGAACLTMICHSLGRRPSFSSLAKIFPPNKYGASLSDISEIAKQIGLKSQGKLLATTSFFRKRLHTYYIGIRSILSYSVPSLLHELLRPNLCSSLCSSIWPIDDDYTLGVGRQVYGLHTKKNRCKTVSYNDFLLFWRLLWRPFCSHIEASLRRERLFLLNYHICLFDFKVLLYIWGHCARSPFHWSYLLALKIGVFSAEKFGGGKCKLWRDGLAQWVQ